MAVNSISGANLQMGQMAMMGMNQATDSYSRNIQNQIASAQKQLQELSSDENMSSEEKMQKRQEIQQKISDLNVQLRQHQAEQRRKKQQAAGTSMDDMLGGTRKIGSAEAGSKATGLSQASMTAMISAGSSVKQAEAQNSTVTHLEGRARVLKSEISLDGGRGSSTQKKEEELADITQRAQKAASSRLSALRDAGKTMEEAAEADSKAKKADDKDEENGESITASIRFSF